MSRIDALNQRYKASASVVRDGAELVVVGDPAGARFNAAVRQLLLVVRDDGPELWDELVGAVKALRWRLVTQPQPIRANLALHDGAERVVYEIRRLRGAVSGSSQQVLDELSAAAQGVTESDPVSGGVLLQSIEEVGAADCVVVAASLAAQSRLAEWLNPHGVHVRTVGQLEREALVWDQAYAVGPPRFFRSSVVTAPATNAVSFLLPSWYGDRSIPRSAIGAYADGALRIDGRVFAVGDLSGATLQLASAEVEDDFLPQPSWGPRNEVDREPTSDEVIARKIVLSGNLAIWLDDGERIRSLDPRQPTGERVTYNDVNAVRVGTCLLLRSGETERRALYDAALQLMGTRRDDAAASQLQWKERLQQRLSGRGHTAVVRELRQCGVKTLDRVRAWTDPTLARPQRERDFELLLEWLGLPIQPTLSYATMLRRLRSQASADIREELETAVAAVDLSVLERDGHLSLDVTTAGFRGIIATRVLAISPYSELISRHDARVPFEDWSARWLE